MCVHGQGDNRDHRKTVQPIRILSGLQYTLLYSTYIAETLCFLLSQCTMSLVGKSKGDRSGKQNKTNRVCIKCLAKHVTQSSLILDKASCLYFTSRRQIQTFFHFMQKVKECFFTPHSLLSVFKYQHIDLRCTSISSPDLTS